MKKVTGIRFRNAGKAYYFDPAGFELKRNDHVIVETVRGLSFGTVAMEPYEVDESKIKAPLLPIERIATEEDEIRNAENRQKEKTAFATAARKIADRGLDMNLVSTEYTFDGAKIIFYFTADQRVDFRELVRDLASIFRARIELRQIGVRDETRMKGGLGVCGRPVCCASYMDDFAPVSVRMAKEQNLSLNPTKISGLCGRLMCCLKYEEEAYAELRSTMPDVGDFVTTEKGERGKVASVDLIRQTARILIERGEEKEMEEYKASELRFTKKAPKNTKKQKNERADRRPSEERPQNNPGD
ncbi:MAG: stage 0 sporulation family protein [Lachnospiraceae bacterium]|nr:stage 0 sporulation family protein [Lachnospiraceae bacterium]